MHILAISGSLRAASWNSLLLKSLARLAPSDIKVLLYRGMGTLPLFNPDLECDEPASVASLRTQIIAADALIIASPEYAHGISGVMKNALDWMVGSEALVYKPVAVLNASPRAHHALTALKETLSVMSARLIEPASITLPILGSKLDEDGVVADLQLAVALRGVLASLQVACQPS